MSSDSCLCINQKFVYSTWSARCFIYFPLFSAIWSLNLESLAGLRLEPDNNKGGDEDDDSICLIPTLKPREEHAFSERGHLSLPSFFGRDLPAKLPRRSYSPIPSDSTNSGSRTRASSLDCGAKL